MQTKRFLNMAYCHRFADVRIKTEPSAGHDNFLAAFVDGADDIIIKYLLNDHRRLLKAKTGKT
ncbi:hypothetical protein BN135_3751 [Cronobacter muytjensii 530]